MPPSSPPPFLSPVPSPPSPHRPAPQTPQLPFLPPPSSPPSPPCHDTYVNDNKPWLVDHAGTSYTGNLSYGCDYFVAVPALCEQERWVDTYPKDVCCICGGGSYVQPPSLPPTPSPSVPPPQQPPPPPPPPSPSPPPPLPRAPPLPSSPSVPSPSTALKEADNSGDRLSSEADAPAVLPIVLPVAIGVFCCIILCGLYARRRMKQKSRKMKELEVYNRSIPDAFALENVQPKQVRRVPSLNLSQAQVGRISPFAVPSTANGTGPEPYANGHSDASNGHDADHDASNAIRRMPSWPAEAQARKEIMANFSDSRPYSCTPPPPVDEQYAELENRVSQAPASVANSTTIARVNSARRSNTIARVTQQFLDNQIGSEDEPSPLPGEEAAPPLLAGPPRASYIVDPSSSPRAAELGDVGLIDTEDDRAPSVHLDLSAAAEADDSTRREAPYPLGAGVAAPVQAEAEPASGGGRASPEIYGLHQMQVLEAMRSKHVPGGAATAVRMDGTLASELQLGDVQDDGELHI